MTLRQANICYTKSIDANNKYNKNNIFFNKIKIHSSEDSVF